MDGDGFRIAVDPAGNPWVLDGDGDVKYWDGTQWFDRPGRGTDIAVGANGDVWMVGWHNDLFDTVYSGRPGFPRLKTRGRGVCLCGYLAGFSRSLCT